MLIHTLEKDTCGFRYINHPTPQYILRSSKKLLPAIVIASHTDEKQSLHRFKSLKE